MRLLFAKTVELKEFSEDEIPPYAILSHTWEKGEVTFQEMKASQSQAATKAGYLKIAGSCKQALRNNVEYVWVDTCCIDKSSSAELTEAINSMFRWYQRAEICYVYLADVPANEDALAFESSFARSRWFTRGWTLQELLAPNTVQFFSNDWRPIGTKTDLCPQISRITGIDSTYLQGTDVKYASIAKRMSWASKRKTRRIEDVAYSLLGLFGVHMPMLYGEGENAFRRLQEEIMKVSVDQSLFAWGYDPNWAPFFHFLSQPPRRVGILARSPIEFANSGNIVPYKGWEFNATFALTSTGVQIRSPICDAESIISSNFRTLANCVATLGCHIEDNFWDVLVLYLETIPSTGQSIRLGKLGRIPRTLWMQSKSSAKQIMLMDRPDIEPRLEPVSAERTFNVSVRLFPLSRRSYRVSGVYPPNSWDETEKMLYMAKEPPGAFSTQYGYEAALLLSREGERCFVVRLRADRTNWDPLFCLIASLPEESNLEEEFHCMNLSRLNPLREMPITQMVDGEAFDVSAISENKWGRKVTVVELDIWSKKEMENPQIQEIRKLRSKLRLTGSPINSVT